MKQEQVELIALCNKGADAVNQGTYDALEFHLFNKAEAEVVKTYMTEHYPNIPYRINRIC